MSERMTTPWAIIIAGALIAVAILITEHYQLVGVGTVPYRLDRWTGRVMVCLGEKDDSCKETQ